MSERIPRSGHRTGPLSSVQDPIARDEPCACPGNLVPIGFSGTPAPLPGRQSTMTILQKQDVQDGAPEEQNQGTS